MKHLTYTILSAAVALMILSACRSDDDFTESIFNTDIPAVDTTQASADFDRWLYDNFTEPYNVEVQYQFNFTASDLSYQLTPADYGRSQLLAHFIRYLFYDVYTKYAGDDFMKQYGPRIFHFIGSSGYNATKDTEVLGTASGGVKITLYKINEMKPWTPGVTYSDDDLITLNENYFHTMHHEFSHILHQTKSYPVTFGQVTSDTYDPLDWNERDSVTTHQLGYVTHYASSATYEDFVETLSCTITDTDYRWMMRIINACAPGLTADTKAEVLTLVDSLGIDPDEAGAHWNNFSLFTETVYNEETGEYDPTERYVLDDHRRLPNTRTRENMVVNKEHTAYVAQYKYEVAATFHSFKDEFLPWCSTKVSDDKPGITAMLKKIAIATEWYTSRWGLYLYTLRREVRERQTGVNDFLANDVVIYDLK